MIHSLVRVKAQSTLPNAIILLEGKKILFKSFVTNAKSFSRRLQKNKQPRCFTDIQSDDESGVLG